ncbi:GNAT family N-acetyltransferase [Lactococcus insecticola]|uniref:Acetyltransferase n=1 Tax=Pseudolactococcus insecticola TaxID=2709158 RepID=A0A6A0B5X4_9LACT|nr:GNAT family N-acetyltransferase [Lactococcus insecticola]GFH40115.1 acetyltransferase [Lactococcus insecticola]
MMSDDFLALATYAFHKAPTGGAIAFNKLLEQSDVHFHTEKHALTSMVVDTHFQVNFQGKIASMSGIGYVASYPEFRGNGAVGALMQEILQENYAKETIFSYLAPFSYQFYEKFGYAYIFDQKQYEIPASDFPPGQKTDLVAKRLTYALALSDLQQVFEQSENNGSLHRSDFEWDYYFNAKKQPYFAVFYAEKQPRGYVSYDFSGMTFVIHELIYLDDVAKNAAYRFIASHAGAFETISYTAPSNEKLETDMLEPSRAKISLRPYMMARIVNLAAFLETFQVATDRQITVTDTMIAENNLTFGNGVAVTMTIGEFTKFVMTDVSLREYF